MITERFVPTHEEQLIQKFLATPALSKNPKNTGHDVVFREVDCNQGRADVVRATFSDPPSRTEAAALAQVLSLPSSAAVLAFLQAAPRSISYLAQTTGLSERVIRQRLAELQGIGLVDSPRPALFRRTDKVARIAAVDIWSFEAKMDKWQRALYQAVQYRGFSHRTTVVLPAARARPALGCLERFRGFGVGLVVVGDREESRVVLRAPRAKPFSKTLFFLALGRAYEALSLDTRKRAKARNRVRPVG